MDNINGSNWMSFVDGRTPITALNIPATHDSATQFCSFSLFSRTQTLSIGEQLKCGARLLDMRVEYSNGEFYSVHGVAECKNAPGFFAGRLTVQQSLEMVERFLNSNPDECVLFMLKEEKSSAGDSFFDAFFERFIAPKKPAWYLKNRIPTLEQARGKIVLLRRCGADKTKFGDENGGIDFTSFPYIGSKSVPDFRFGIISSADAPDEPVSQIYLQDSYKLPAKSKIEAYRLFLASRLDCRNFNICALNCIGGGMVPLWNASKVNADFEKYELSDYFGIVMLDAITPALGRKIYITNIK